jgi:bacteriorhodopsin
MEFLVAALKTTLTGTLTIPGPPLPTTTTRHGHHGGHHHSTSLTITSTATGTATGTAIPSPTPLPPPPTGSIPQNLHFDHITKTGHTVFVVFTVIFAIATIMAFFMSKRVERKLRLFHQIILVMLATATLAYLTAAFDLGWTYVPSYRLGSGHHGETHVFRQVFYSRVISWAVSAPLTVLALALLAGLPLFNTFSLLIAVEMMIVSVLVFCLSRSTEVARWSFFAVGLMFFIYVLWNLVTAGRAAAKLQSDKVQRVYLIALLIAVLSWTGYPIVLALAEGKGRISVNAEVIAFGVLDFFSVIVFGMYILLGHSHTEGDSVVISDFWSEPRGSLRAGYGALSQDD